MASHPKISDLRDEVQVITATTVTNAEGFPVPSEALSDPIRAHLRPVPAGRERFYGGQTEGVNTFIVTIRRPEDTTIDNSATLLNKYCVGETSYERRLSVVRVIDRDNRHEWLDMTCEELGSSQ